MNPSWYKRLWKYLLYLSCILLFFCLMNNLSGILKGYAQTHFNPFIPSLVLLLFYFLSGFLLSLHHLYHQWQKEGAWCVNWFMLLTLAIPLFFLGSIPQLSFFIPMLSELTFPLGWIYIPIQLIMCCSGFFFGSSFYRQPQLVSIEQ